jgi:hypothetical protein
MYNVIAVSPVKERIIGLAPVIINQGRRNRLYNIIYKDGFGVKRKSNTLLAFCQLEQRF